ASSGADVPRRLPQPRFLLLFGNTGSATAIRAAAREANTCRYEFQRGVQSTGLAKPPITIKCECGETRDVAYGDRWRCEACGRSWNTQQIPAEEYEGLLRRVRRHQLEALGMAALVAAILVPLIVVVSSGFILLVPMVMAAWLFVFLPF